MVINTNISAQNSASLLAESSSQLSKSLARLSSGSKIISPDDDVAGAGVAVLTTGIEFPHFGHLTSVGILAGFALILSFALQLPHSMGIRSIPFSLHSSHAILLKTTKNSSGTPNKQPHFRRKYFAGYHPAELIKRAP
ncbi:MAG: hypothetical protein WCO42_09115 [bacterium]